MTYFLLLGVITAGSGIASAGTYIIATYIHNDIITSLVVNLFCFAFKHLSLHYYVLSRLYIADKVAWSPRYVTH